MVIDMHAKGVEVRPLKMATGGSEFNEVFFNDVFVPDDDVIGPGRQRLDRRPGHARQRERQHRRRLRRRGRRARRRRSSGCSTRTPSASAAAPPASARYLAINQAMAMLNLRTGHPRRRRAAGPGPEGNITKLVLSEQGHEATAIMSELAGSGHRVHGRGRRDRRRSLVLWHRAMSIAGGTSEIKRNQIGERILGLPRDPLIK